MLNRWRESLAAIVQLLGCYEERREAVYENDDWTADLSAKSDL